MAMGFTPLVAAALSGCTIVSSEPIEPKPVVPPESVTAPDATTPSETSLEGEVPEEPPVDDPIDPVPPFDPDITLLHATELHEGHQGIVKLTGWHPNDVIWLWGSGLASADPNPNSVTDYWDAREVSLAHTDSQGSAVFKFLTIPTGASEISLEVDPNPAQSNLVFKFPTSAVTADFPEYSEVGPLVTDEELLAEQNWRACVPKDAYGGVCPGVEDFHPWQTAEIVGFAMDRTIAPDIRGEACEVETAFTASCCYVFGFQRGQGNISTCPQPDVGDTDLAGDTDWWVDTGWGLWDYEGRPFGTNGEVSVASPVRGAGWANSMGQIAVPAAIRDAAARAWLKAGQAEHASVAAFARFTLELMSVGAPADLVAQSTQAQSDEIRHATACFGVASSIAGSTVGVGSLSLDGAFERSESLADIVRAAVIEGCIHETISAVNVQRGAAFAKSTDLKQQMLEIAEDEVRHAELSWAFVKWALTEHPELHDVVSQAFADFDAGKRPEDRGPDLNDWGVLSASQTHDNATEILMTVIMPCARALLRATERPA